MQPKKSPGACKKIRQRRLESLTFACNGNEKLQLSPGKKEPVMNSISNGLQYLVKKIINYIHNHPMNADFYIFDIFRNVVS